MKNRISLFCLAILLSQSLIGAPRDGSEYICLQSSCNAQNDNCLCSISTGIDELKVDFQETWTTLGSSPCQAISILSEDIDPATGTITISEPGSYKLCENISLTQIIIDSDDVVFNLNDFTATFTTTGEINFISVSNHNNISINNGTIKTTGFYDEGRAIYCFTCNNIFIENMKIINCYYGIHFEISTNFVIKNCFCSAIEWAYFLASSSENGILSDCIATNILPRHGSGFQTSSVSGINLYDCIATTTQASGDGFATGFLITNNSNLLYHCVAINNVVGFNMTAGINKHLLDQCIAIENTTNYSAGAAYYSSLCQSISGGVFTWIHSAPTLP